MLILREASIDDLIGIAKVKIDTWKTTYKGIISDEALENLDLYEQAEKFKDLLPEKDNKKFLLVAEVDGVIVGFSAGGIEREGNYGIDGEVYAIYVLKQYQNQNIGKSLMKCSIEKLSGMGLNSFLIWVLESNPYKQFYEKLGGVQIDRKPLDSSDDSPFITAYAWE
jgi:GNAT superfamily N-acetyltransferase